jgi:hypothetical protein
MMSHNFGHFLTPLPYCHAFYYWGLSTVVTKSLTPSPYDCDVIYGQPLKSGPILSLTSCSSSLCVTVRIKKTGDKLLLSLTFHLYKVIFFSKKLTVSWRGWNIQCCSSPLCKLTSALVSLVWSLLHFWTCRRADSWMCGRVSRVCGVARIPQDPVDGGDRRNGRSVTDLLRHKLTEKKWHRSVTYLWVSRI